MLETHEQVSSDTPNANICEPLFTLSVDDDKTNDESVHVDLSIDDVAPAQVEDGLTELSNESDANIENKITAASIVNITVEEPVSDSSAIENEDGSMPTYINDANLSTEYATSIEIRGPPLNESVNIDSEESEVDLTILSDYAAEKQPDGTIELPDLYLVDPAVDYFDGQIVYLDFDGATDVTYNGPVVVEGNDIPEFSADAAGLAGQEQEIISQILAALEETFEGSGVIFTLTEPDAGTEYSTIYIGGNDSAFAEYGSFLGLAEQVDLNNLNPSDNAFVFSENIVSADSDSNSIAAGIAGLIAHEVGHLLGYRHLETDGDGLLDSLAEVVSPVCPTVELTDRLNGIDGYNGDPQLETAPVVNGALYTNDVDIADIGAGSGVLQSFVRISESTDTIQGYNTSGRPVQYQENTSLTFTHDMPLAAIPVSYFDVDGDGTEEAYLEFRLDINEPDTDLKRWMSVDIIQIWQSNDPSLHSAPPPGFVPATDDADQAYYEDVGGIGVTVGFVGADGNYLVYSMDSGEEGNWVGINYTLNPGSGVADMVLLIPAEYFDPDMGYVYLFSQFGGQSGTSDIYWDSDQDFVPDETLYGRTWQQDSGFEEWAILAEIPGEKSGVKFEDLNANGVQDPGEEGIAGWTIYVYEDENANGLLDAGESLVTSITTSDGTTDYDGDGITDDVGFYWFELDSITYDKVKGDWTFVGGHYIVLEEARAGWVQSTPLTDVVDTGSAPGATEFGYAVAISPGERETGNDFGNWQQASKSGTKYEDLDADGSIAGDPGLENWDIYVYEDTDEEGD
ncbi:MAG: hypothetical protein ACYS21_13310, partial [Planctomycetota bacterium]